MTFHSRNLRDFRKFAENLVSELKTNSGAKKNATLVCLSGNLGVGKTTLTQIVAEILGLKENITSPTFVIEKIYKLKDTNFNHLIHIDAYRLKSGAELLKLGWTEILEDPKNLIFLEWPENVKEILTRTYFQVNLEILDGEERKINLEQK